MHELKNNFIKITVAEKGAELQGFYEAAKEKEWLWQGDAKYWGKRAPVLFPFIGALKNNSYIYNGTAYPMSKHGFARDMAFQLESQTGDQLAFLLASSPETLKSYPFEFEFRITYKLQDRTLHVIHEVLNKGEEEMIFSLGGHPAFNCPMASAAWHLEFEQPEQLESYLINLDNGLIKNEKKSLPTKGKLLDLAPDLFQADALVFENLKSRYVDLVGPSSEERLRFTMEGFPLLAFWTPMAPFLCIEPWYGMADMETAEGHLEEKLVHGAVRLGAKERFETRYSISAMPSQVQRP